jgi:lipopolysaccharide biosynthesis glycosyltransferase
MPVCTYQKLTLGDWLPGDVQRVVWLDCDLLVLGDLGELWDKQIGSRTALAVQDQRVPLVSSRFGVAGCRDLGLSTEAKYFNAGVMLVDLAAWRGDEVGVKAREYLLNYADRVYFWDQEALNAVLAGKWGEMDLQWYWQWAVPIWRALTRRYYSNGE